LGWFALFDRTQKRGELRPNGSSFGRFQNGHLRPDSALEFFWNRTYLRPKGRHISLWVGYYSGNLHIGGRKRRKRRSSVLGRDPPCSYLQIKWDKLLERICCLHYIIALSLRFGSVFFFFFFGFFWFVCYNLIDHQD
jgi:hypothetical protein